MYIGDLSGVFHAVDAATGKVRWTYKTQAEIKSSPIVVGDKVLIGCDGHLYGLNAATGKFLWKVSTDNYVHATPAIWNGGHISAAAMKSSTACASATALRCLLPLRRTRPPHPRSRRASPTTGRLRTKSWRWTSRRRR